MNTTTDNNNGLGYARRFAEKNAAGWAFLYPEALITLVPFRRGWSIVVDVKAE